MTNSVRNAFVLDDVINLECFTVAFARSYFLAKGSTYTPNIYALNVNACIEAVKIMIK